MRKELLNNIVRFLEKQDMLNKLTENQKLNDLGIRRYTPLWLSKSWMNPM